ncbi:hypothetical protein GW17_00054601 [Ensete ventricosum]|nr:hypothetical protein GW17_00054601 [Ensete ventricosum]RZS10732.1 hypothetical protein BHM03_00041996 [Ensete ventricosum]
MRTQRLGWLSSSNGSTLATKLDDAQGKVGRLVKDETVQSGRYCVMTERVVQSSQSYSTRRSSPKGIVVSETSSGENVKRKDALTGQTRRDKS